MSTESSAPAVDGLSADASRAARPAPGPPAPTVGARLSPSTTPKPPPEFPDGIDPVTVAIPAIGVDADVIDLSQLPDGTLEVPEDFAETGWWSGGPRPGQLGAAVIAGHVDSRSGPAVFYRLRDLRPGDEIVVRGRDGKRETFSVDRVEQHPKDEFPTAAVYGYTSDPTLRLVTCGGDFDRSQRSYVDNLVVFAHRTTS